MPRLLGTLVLLLTLAAPVASAAADDLAKPSLPEAPDLAPVARAIASGASSAADATGDALGALADGVAALAKAAGAALAALAGAIGAAFVALAQGTGAALGALGRLLGAIASAIAAGLAALASALAALGLAGARQVAAHPAQSAIAAGSAGAAGLAAWAANRWWLSLFVPLYSRLARSEMLDNKVRASVYEHVKAHPGAHPSRISSTLGLGWGTVVYHLARLEESSLVTARSSHNRKCYFAVGSELDNAGRSAVAAMSTDKARAIVETLQAAPGLSQKELAERLDMSQALASWHVKRLVASGVLVTARSGRSNLLHVAEHVPVVTVAPPALAA